MTSSVAAGIYNDHATMTVTNCTISGNSGRSVGGIYSDGYGDIGSTVAATLSVLNSTISGNSDTNGGGGIYSDGSNTNGSATLTVTPSRLARSRSARVSSRVILNW